MRSARVLGKPSVGFGDGRRKVPAVALRGRRATSASAIFTAAADRGRPPERGSGPRPGMPTPPEAHRPGSRHRPRPPWTARCARATRRSSLSSPTAPTSRIGSSSIRMPAHRPVSPCIATQSSNQGPRARAKVTRANRRPSMAGCEHRSLGHPHPPVRPKSSRAPKRPGSPKAATMAASDLAMALGQHLERNRAADLSLRPRRDIGDAARCGHGQNDGVGRPQPRWLLCASAPSCRRRCWGLGVWILVTPRISHDPARTGTPKPQAAPVSTPTSRNAAHRVTATESSTGIPSSRSRCGATPAPRRLVQDQSSDVAALGRNQPARDPPPRAHPPPRS